MNRSHVAPLLITVFALATLGIAASIHTAHPDTTIQGRSADTFGGSHAGQTSERQSQSVGHIHPFAFPDLNAEQGLNARPIQSGHTLQRLAIGLTLLIFGAILVIHHLTSNDPHGEPPAEATDTTVNEHALDTLSVPISDPPPTNDVYRAWRAMITSLDVPWECQETPTELAQKAIRAGLPETPVTNLTALFCSVRYGGKPPTDEREQCAQHALDQIQQTEQSTDAESCGWSERWIRGVSHCHGWTSPRTRRASRGGDHITDRVIRMEFGSRRA